MAKLTAHGRTELVRLVQRVETPDNEFTTARVNSVVLCSDNVILHNIKVMQKAGTFTPAGWHNYGWTKRGKLRAGVTVAEFRRVHEAAGFVVA